MDEPTFDCPRRMWGSLPGPDTYREDDTCSYCGSLNPTTLMQRLERGDIELGPTDKNYKVYVRNKDGAKFKQTSRTDDDRTGDRTKWVWETREVDDTKFYFQHLSEDQMRRFIELLNEQRIALGYPGHFYRRPFFIAPTL